MSCTAKICGKCEISYSINNYRQYSDGKFSNTCKSCLNEMDKIRKKNMRQNKADTFIVKCEKCNIDPK